MFEIFGSVCKFRIKLTSVAVQYLHKFTVELRRSYGKWHGDGLSLCPSAKDEEHISANLKHRVVRMVHFFISDLFLVGYVIVQYLISMGHF